METSIQEKQNLKHFPMALAIADLSSLVRGQGPGALPWLNDTAMLLFGLSDQPSQGIEDILGEAGPQILLSLVASLEKGGAPAEVYEDFHLAGASPRRLKIRAAWSEGTVGAWDRVLLFFEEETEVPRLEDPSAKENLFRAILETTAEGYFLLDARGRFLDVNTAYCELMGYSREEVLSISIVDQAEDPSPERLAARLTRIRSLGRETFEARYRRQDGSLFDVEISSSYLAGDQGRFICFCRDISPRKRAGLWDWDVVGGSLLVDANWGAILGIGPSDLRAFHKQDWDSLCHPEDLRASEIALLDHFLGEVVERDDQGRPTRVIGLMFDIDAQKGSEGRLRTTIAEKESLLSELFQAEMAPVGKCIEFRASEAATETVEVSADVAIPCGLILSELVGNSVAHGFHSRDSGSISVSVYKDVLGEIHIEEWDDGVGLPEGYDPRAAGRVGLRTVIGIGEEQLHGMFSFGTEAQDSPAPSGLRIYTIPGGSDTWTPRATDSGGTT